MAPTTIELRLSEYDRTKFVAMLERQIDRLRALRDLRHTTQAEQQLLIYEMALCQTILVQVGGDTYRPVGGAPDWEEEAHEAGVAPNCENCRP